MRHVLDFASRRSYIALLNPTPLHHILHLGPRSRSTLPLSIKKRKEKTFSGTTNIKQIACKASGIVNNTKDAQTEPLSSTEGTDTSAFGQEEEERSPTSPPKTPASVKTPPKFKAFKRISRDWKILDPAYSLDFFARRNSLDNRMHSYIQFITTPTSDTPGTSLALHFDDRRYIVGNAHEGLHRASLQMGARVLRTKDIFLTGRTEWQSTGGLMGMIMTIADAATASAESKAETARRKLMNRRNRECEEGKRRKKKTDPDVKLDTGSSQMTPTAADIAEVQKDPTVRLHGGPNLTHTIATARSFIYRKGTPIKVLEHIKKNKGTDEGESKKNKSTDEDESDWEPTWSDHRIQVWAMPIEPADVSKSNTETKQESPRKRSLGEFMSGGAPDGAETLNQWPGYSAPSESQDQRTRELAVSGMFSSTWNRDNFIEVPLRDVQMPAQIHIRDPVTNEVKMYEGPIPNGSSPVPDVNVLIRQVWPGALIDHLPPTRPSGTAMSYVIRNHKMRGKFNVVAADKLQVPLGAARAALVAGHSVQSSDGLTVTPDMILGPSKDGAGVAVIDLPSSEYIPDLINRPEWNAPKVMSGVVAIIWILGPGVVQERSLVNFIEGQPGVQHIISSPEHCPNYLSMTSAATNAIRHHQVDPSRYSVPVHSNVVPPTSDVPSDAGKRLFEVMSNCRPAERGLTVKLEPQSGVEDTVVVPYLNTHEVVQSTPKDVLDLSRAARQQIGTPAVQAETLSQNLPSPDAEIICLGTGSAMPSQYRNVAATLLRVPGSGSYLMDCGENTLGQLKRMYTAPQLAELFRDLKLIWISHLHADHHLGLTSVIKAWYEEIHGSYDVKRRRPTVTEQMLDPAKFVNGGERLFVVSTGKMMKWLEEYSSVEDYGFDQIVPLVSIPNLDTNTSNLEWNSANVGFNLLVDDKIKRAIRSATGLSNLVSCPVSHCFGAQAVSLTFPTGFKFSYSGDCRPSRRFAHIGQNSTVLVHEATFDDDLRSEALAKKHSTTSEAIGVGVAMGARRVILTHFSQRYQKIPSSNALDTRGIKLEDAEDIEDPWADKDLTIEEPTEPQTAMDMISDSQDDDPSRAQPKSSPRGDVGAPVLPSVSTTSTLAQIIASNVNPTPRPKLNDMKIGVAFDNMRVKVGEIMHLDKFTPALMELYKDEIEEPANKRPAKEAFSDDENDMLQQEQKANVKTTEKRSPEEKAERARKGQIKAAKKRAEKEEKEKREIHVMETKEETKGRPREVEGGDKVEVGAMERIETTEPVEGKMKAVQ